MNMLQRFLGIGLISLCGAISLTACASDEGSDATTTTPPPPAASFTTQTVDARAGGAGAPASDPRNKYTYLNLATGSVVELSDTDAATSSEWDIAFKRSLVKLNGGISGPKGAVGYFTGNNAEAYGPDGNDADDKPDPILSWFQAATAETELPDFEAVTAVQIPDDTQFKADRLVPSIKGDGTSDGWWLYDPTTHAVTANSTNWWVVKSDAGNSYAKFHVAELVRDSTAGVRRFTLEWYYQGSADTEFGAGLQTRVVEVPLAGGAKYLDFDVPADDADPANVPAWDLKVEYIAASTEYRMTLNGSVSGSGQAAAFGPIPQNDSDDESTDEPDDMDDYTMASKVPHYTTDSAGGIFVDSSWYAYNLTGNDHKLWPNYRVYLIKAGADVYKFQILGYYHPQTTTESGWYTIRYEKIAP